MHIIRVQGTWKKSDVKTFHGKKRKGKNMLIKSFPPHKRRKNFPEIIMHVIKNSLQAGMIFVRKK